MNVMLQQILGKLDIKQTVFWVGAGIDIDEPTCLPSGNELTEFIIKNGFGDGNNKFLKEYKNQCNLINEKCIYAKLDGIPRLETVIGVLQRFENQKGQKKIPSFLKGFSSFANAFPNHTHFSLAQLLYKGATIVTTNYDLCIPKAYSQLFPNERDKLFRRQIGNGIFVYYSLNQDVGKMYYIHGIADKIESLGYSLQNVMQSLSGEFFDEMSRKYLMNSLFVFLGYSGLDNLDVNLMFESLHRMNSNSCAICIVYPKAELTEDQNNLLGYFNNYYAFKMYLDDFFGYYDNLSSIEYVQTIKGEKGMWKRGFEAYPVSFHVFIQMALAYEFGIGLDIKMEDLNNKDIDLYLEEWYINFYTSHLKVHNSCLATVKSFFSKKYDKYHKLIADPQVEKTINNSIEKIGWDTVTPINTTVKSLLKLYSVGKIFVSKQKIESFYEIVKSLVQHKKYQDFEELREFYVLELCMAMLTAMKQVENSESKVLNIIKKVSEEYSRVSMLDGVLNAECIYLKIEYIFLKRKGKVGEWKEYILRVLNYCKLLSQLGRTDRLLQFWLR